MMVTTMHDNERGSLTRYSSGGGFTLVELLVVAAIIALLIGILLPAIGRTREISKRVVCLSNQRQMHLAATAYADTNQGRFPVAYWQYKDGPNVTWEITTLADGSHTPGLLWDGEGSMEIQQCPSFDGPDAWTNAPFTGYNYNTSYLGHGQFEDIPTPTKISRIRQPSECMIFGDGGFAGGANKFMRAPFPNPGDAGFSGRHGGTQAFRHLDSTNGVFVDGHGATLQDRHTNTTSAWAERQIADGTGFVSEDNSLYDLR